MVKKRKKLLFAGIEGGTWWVQILFFRWKCWNCLFSSDGALPYKILNPYLRELWVGLVMSEWKQRESGDTLNTSHRGSFGSKDNQAIPCTRSTHCCLYSGPFFCIIILGGLYCKLNFKFIFWINFFGRIYKEPLCYFFTNVSWENGGTLVLITLLFFLFHWINPLHKHRISSSK